MSRADAGGIAGFCFLACIVMVVVAGFDQWAPALRHWILWVLTPQFVVGVALTTVCFFTAAVIFAWESRE